MNQFRMWDFAILGAGPAGCAAALELAQSGARVGLLEKAAFPRDKLCGEFLSPEVARILDDLGCGPQFRAAQPASIERGVVVTPSGARLEFPLPAPAYGLSRLRFDHLLAEAAQQAGAELIEKVEIAGGDRHSCLSQLPASQTLEARDGRRFRARAVVLAAGRHSLLQPLHSLPSPLRPSPAAPGWANTGRSGAYFGFKAHYEGDCAGRVELYFFRGGYCGLAPVEGGRVNLCCLVEKSLLAGCSAEQLLAKVPALRARLAGLRRTEPFLHTGPVAMGWRRPPPGLFPAGDAALFVDPFTGDGIALALETGRLAARHALRAQRDAAPIEEQVAEYLEELRRRFGRQLRAGQLLRAAAATPWLERPLLRLLASAALRRAALRAAFRATRDFGRLATVRQSARQ